MLGLQAVPGETRTGGRSRFSKALPSVPFDDLELPPPPPLPKEPYQLQMPAFPSPRLLDDDRSVKSIARKPVGSSSSSKPGTPLPPSFGPGTPQLTSPPPISSSNVSMAIPRRPVGATAQPAVPLSLVAPPEPSPTDSICSLLSAYSRDPDAPKSGRTHTTTTAASSPREFDTLSPTTTAPPSLGGQKSPLASEYARESDVAPFLPPKDGSALDPILSPLKPLPSAPSAQEEALLPPRPEIWRRRPQTSEKNKELPDLKLNYSHGSTTSVSSVQTAVINASSETVGDESVADIEPALLPGNPLAGLPGRNVRPPPKDKTLESTDFSTGSGSSKMMSPHKEKETPHGDKSSTEVRAFPPRTDSKRPPTPEYRAGDINPPPALADRMVKPASPISATGSPKEGLQTDTSKTLPPQSPKLDMSAAPTFSSTPFESSSTQRLPSSVPDLRLATSFQDLRRSRPSPSIEVSSPLSTRQNLAIHARETSASPDPAAKRISPSGPNGLGLSMGPPRRPGTAAGGPDPRIVFSDTQGPMYRGRDGTLYPEMKITGEPDPRAAYFPLRTDKTWTPGTIIASRPLSESHFSCFHRHKAMNRRSNRNYPLTCQTCDKADVEDRWVCMFCHLRICEGCLQSFNDHQRNLRSLVDGLGTSTPLSLSSASRPGSALGIQVPA
ncbi:hypothetical protein AAL_03558 [Moelleriella libera RCEF 2490]|uniref:Uncharacterized protein n=1 Tax=Moelleriella libera RCEF 2490 TaxID=1081109 RepID=A0A168DCF4_9HYPO|nr:hypothetical protein AAL_03558 [Moelleriella libera RCEF 2490]